MTLLWTLFGIAALYVTALVFVLGANHVAHRKPTPPPHVEGGFDIDALLKEMAK